jgi:hypothetical protein
MTSCLLLAMRPACTQWQACARATSTHRPRGTLPHPLLAHTKPDLSQTHHCSSKRHENRRWHFISNDSVALTAKMHGAHVHAPNTHHKSLVRT